MTEQATPSPTQVATEIFQALKEHDLDAVFDRGHPDVVDDFVVVGRFEGREAVRAFFTALFDAFPDFDIDVVHMVGDDQHAVVQWHATGSFTGGPFQGVHATGRSIELRGCDVMRFEDAKLIQNTIYYDGLAFARQIGLLPREGSSADKAMMAAFNAGTDVKAQVAKRTHRLAHAN